MWKVGGGNDLILIFKEVGNINILISLGEIYEIIY